MACRFKRRAILYAALALWLCVCIFGCEERDPSAGPEPTSAKHVEPAIVTDDDATHTAKKIELRILYVGHPDSDREKDYTAFLARHFTQVKTADLDKFQQDQTVGSDVTILDYDGDPFQAPRPNISHEYDRATITVGVVGAFVCDRLSLKTGYL